MKGILNAFSCRFIYGPCCCCCRWWIAYDFDFVRVGRIMKHFSEESATSGRSWMSGRICWSGSSSTITWSCRSSTRWRTAKELAISRTILSVRKSVDERIDDTRSPSENRSQDVHHRHFSILLQKYKLQCLNWKKCWLKKEQVDNYLIIGDIDDHQGQEAEQETAEDD